MEYWKEISVGLIGTLGGIIVIWRFLSGFLTKVSHTEMCDKRLELIRAETRVAVLEAMNEWLRENGHQLKK